MKHIFYADFACVMISRRHFEEIGPYDEALFLFHEDIDMCWRARQIGIPIMVRDDLIVYNDAGGAILHEPGKRPAYRTSYFRRYHGEKNILRNILKNYELQNLLWAVPLYVLQQAVEVVAMILLRRGSFARADVDALLWNVRSLNDTLRMRSAVQRKRRVPDSEIMRVMYRGFSKYTIFRAVGVPQTVS